MTYCATLDWSCNFVLRINDPDSYIWGIYSGTKT